MVDQKVLDYIKSSLEHGVSREDLYRELLQKGWTVEVIQACFDAIVTTNKQEDSHKRIIRLVVTIGAILIGAGIFSFIAANWQEMTKFIKILLIVTSMLFSYLIGWYLKDKPDFEKIGDALILLGTILYGAGIFLIAQMFHTGANWPDGFIIWMIGSILVAVALNSYSHFWLAIILGFVAVIGHPIEIFTGMFGYRAFLSTSSLLLLVASIMTFWVGLSVRKNIPSELKDLY